MQMLETTFFFLFFPASLFSRSLVLNMSLRNSLVYTAVMRDGGGHVCARGSVNSLTRV